MEEFKGTPGPWRVIEDEQADVIRIVEKHDYNPGFYTEICEISQGIDEAHLIAAAPDLLEVLNECVELMKVQEFKAWLQVIAKAEAAINNALGMEVSNG
ncbi:hypothetical protein [Pedobacter sp. NJ-S-72]